MNHQKRYF